MQLVRRNGNVRRSGGTKGIERRVHFRARVCKFRLAYASYLLIDNTGIQRIVLHANNDKRFAGSEISSADAVTLILQLFSVLHHQHSAEDRKNAVLFWYERLGEDNTLNPVPSTSLLCCLSFLTIT